MSRDDLVFRSDKNSVYSHYVQKSLYLNRLVKYQAHTISKRNVISQLWVISFGDYELVTYGEMLDNRIESNHVMDSEGVK